MLHRDITDILCYVVGNYAIIKCQLKWIDLLLKVGICESMDSQVTGAATVLAQCEPTALSEYHLTLPNISESYLFCFINGTLSRFVR